MADLRAGRPGSFCCARSPNMADEADGVEVPVEHDEEAPMDAEGVEEPHEQAVADEQRMLPPDTFRLTDTGNADRLIHLYGQGLKWCGAWGCWLVWSGRHWERDEGRRIDRYVRATIDEMYEEIAGTDEDRRQLVAKWVVKSDSASKMRDMTELARCQVAVRQDTLDRLPMSLNVANGTVDLETGRLREHRPADLLTVVLATPYVADATCPRWEQFLREVFLDDEGLIGYVQRLVGYSITGDGREHVLPVCHGGGANGKNTLLDTLLGLLEGYGYQAPSRMLMTGAADEHACELAALYGKRLAVASETEAGRKLKTALVKGLTGDAKITARRMRENFWTFDRTAKIWLVTNHKPRVTDESEGIWRRLKLIPFNATFLGKRADPLLMPKLRGEYAGILAWAVRGCLDWQRQGLGDPPAVEHATKGYRAEEDRVGAFVQERLVVTPGDAVAVTLMRAAYEGWAKAAGEEPLDGRAFNEQMHNRGLVNGAVKRAGVVFKAWKGVTVRPAGR